MEHEELTRSITGCAYRVYNRLGHGFLESVYQKSMLIELRRAGIEVQERFPIRVLYDGVEVGAFEADLFVAGAVIVELKAVSVLVKAHEVQLVNYLKATGIEVGLLMNFGEDRVEVRRRTRTLPDVLDPG